MKLLGVLALGYQQFVLVYFAILNLAYALFGYRGLRQVISYAHDVSEVGLRDLVEREVYEPVSILVPAYNEESSIVASVRSFLRLHYPRFEVIVVSDGSKDATVERLIAAFELIEEERVWARILPTKPVRRVFRSLRHPELLVIDKDNGGKADALNVGINFARHPVFCGVDADSLLDVDALLRAARLFVEDDTVVAVGGNLRLLNGCKVENGLVTEVRMPRLWIERFQLLEYARAFFTGRAGWSAIDALLIISGAFGLFRRDVVLAAGGYRVGTVGEDMELVVRLHKHCRQVGRPGRVVFTPDPLCWTEAPSDWETLRKQRNRWHRGLWETLWEHRDMLFNPRYGRLGMLAVPYFWIFEAAAPIVEVVGYALLPVGLVLGLIAPWFAVAFLLLAVLYGVLLSQLAVGIETLLLARYSRLGDRLLLLLVSFVEGLGYRQLLAVERFMATFQVQSKRHKWGAMKRTGIGT